MMGVNMRNSEGYYDPTAYEALSNIEREAKAARAFRPIVYICSPLSGDMDANQEAARRYCRYAVDSGYIPICRCKNKHVFSFGMVNTCLHSHIFLRIRVINITVGELIHIVKKDNRRGVCDCFLKGSLDLLDKLSVW